MREAVCRVRSWTSLKKITQEMMDGKSIDKLSIFPAAPHIVGDETLTLW